MATIRAALVTTKFPYNFDELCSTIVVNKGLATQRLGQGNFNAVDAPQAEGIPQAYYMENVLPISRGYTSVAYTQMIPPIPGNPNIFDMFTIRDGAAGLAYLAIGFETQYIYDSDTLEWITVNLGAFSPGTVTVATVKGISYIGVGQVGLYQYNFATKVLEEQEVLGLDVGEILGWFGAGANLCAWTINRILWSSNLNPLDFVPSLSTGAGSSSVLAISSEITTCLSLGEDFIIYTSTNAVAGRQTGNIQYPFIFTEVLNSVGVSSQYHVAYNSNSGVHIAWTPLGFQEVTVQEATFIWAELRDGISRGIQILLDPVHELPYLHYVPSLDVRLSFSGNSGVMVSLREVPEVGEDPPFTEAHVYDTNLQRWGRLNCEHRMFFQFTVQSIEGRYTYAQLEADYLNYSAIDYHTPPLSYSDIESNPVPAAGVPGANFGVLGIDGKVHVVAPQQTEQFRGDNEGIISSTPRIFLGRYKVIEEEGVVIQRVQLKKLFAAELRVHGHAINGEILKTRFDWFPHPTQKDVWYEELSADSVTIEALGSFILSDLSIECISSGTNYPLSPIVPIPFMQYIQGESPDIPVEVGTLMISGRWSSYPVDQKLAGGDFLPGIMPAFNVHTGILETIYQRPKLMNSSNTVEYQGMYASLVIGDYIISSTMSTFEDRAVAHFVAITPYLADEEILLQAPWQDTALIAGVDYKLYDIGSDYIVQNVVRITDNLLVVVPMINSHDEFGEPIIPDKNYAMFGFINFTDELTGTIDLVEYSAEELGINADTVLSNYANTEVAVNMATGEFTALLTGTDLTTFDSVYCYIRIDTVTKQITETFVTNEYSYDPTATVIQSSLPETVADFPTSSLEYSSIECSYENVNAYGDMYDTDLVSYAYTSRQIVDTVYMEYVDEVNPTLYILAELLGEKLASLGYSLPGVPGEYEGDPGYPANYLPFQSRMGYTR